MQSRIVSSLTLHHTYCVHNKCDATEEEEEEEATEEVALLAAC
jgi:hypothetical protein